MTTKITKPLSLERTIESLAFHLSKAKKHYAGVTCAAIEGLFDNPEPASMRRHMEVLRIMLKEEAPAPAKPKADVTNMADFKKRVNA